MSRQLIQSVVFTVECDHVRGQGRPRFRLNGGTYKSNEDKAWEKRIRDAYSAQCPYKDMAGFADEVHISIHAHRRLPSSAPARIESEPDLNAPDADNIAKSVLDALSRLAFRDDKQVTQLNVFKHDRKRIGKERMTVHIKYYAEVGER